MTCISCCVFCFQSIHIGMWVIIRNFVCKTLRAHMILAHRNHSAFCDLRLQVPSRTPEICTKSSTQACNREGRKRAASCDSKVVGGQLPHRACVLSTTDQHRAWIPVFWCAGTTPILEKTLRECMGKWNYFMGVPINSGNHSGSCSENCGFRIAQVVGSHSENGISYSENGILNSESCSENTPELSESSENVLTPRAFFLKLGWSPRFWSINQACPRVTEIDVAWSV